MCGTASNWAKVALACAFVGMSLHIAGWATNFWMVFELASVTGLFQAYIGLWWQKVCDIVECTTSDTDALFETDAFNAMRGLETVTFGLSIFGTIVLFVYVLMEAARTRCVAMVLLILFFIAGTCSAVGMVILLIEINAPFIMGYSAGLTTIASPLLLITATLLIPDLFEESSPLDRRQSEIPRSFTPPRGRDTPLSPRYITTGWTP